MAVLLVILIPLTSFAPGFLLVRRMHRWGPLEKLAASLGASIVLIYLVAFAIYVSGLPWSTAWGFTALSALALAIARDDARRLFAMPQVRRVVWQFGALFAWNLLMLLIVRQYAGGWWGPDWYEHYERALFFVGRGPLQYEFIGRYLLPARPPLMNLASAFYLAQAGTQFANFQITFAFLNVLPFVPLVLLSSVLTPGRLKTSPTWSGRLPHASSVLAVLLACNPMFLHNAQFSWTKAAVGFFVALALWFYIVGWRRQDPRRMALAFLSLAAGTLVHYSCGPYVIALGLHYVLWLLWQRRRRWLELAACIIPSAALLATWFWFSVSTYGLEHTLATNTSVTDASRLTLGGNLIKIGTNIFNTLIPHLARGQWVERDDAMFRQVVDNAFCVYQVTLPFMFGLGGFVAIAFLAVRTAREDADRHRAERIFWLVFTVLAVVLGIAAHGDPDVWGVAHIGLQPIGQIGLAWLAASTPALPRWLRYVLLAGVAVDLVMGVAIRVHMEALLAGWATDYNLEVKQKAGVVFLGDWFPAMTGPLQVVLWLGSAALLARLARLLRAV